MKKFPVLLLAVLLMLSSLPVSGGADNIEAVGYFQGRLLAEGHDTGYHLSLQNASGVPLEALLVLALYENGTLVSLQDYPLSVEAGGTLTESRQLSGVTGSVTEAKAFVFQSRSTLSPLLRADRLGGGYESIYNAFARESLVTELGVLPADSAECTQRFPVSQTMTSQCDSQDVNGLGMLGYFTESPEEIYISLEKELTTRPSAQRFTPFRTVRVLNPAGQVVCYYDFSDENAETEIVLRVPDYEGAGIWTVSYTTGLYCRDVVTLAMPETEYWGIRGEMTLGFLDKTETKKPLYLYVPEFCVGSDCEILIKGYAGKYVELYDAAGAKIPYLTDDAGNKATYCGGSAICTTITEAQADTCWTLSFQTTTDNKNYFDDSSYDKTYNTPGQNAYFTVANGLPGLLCQTEAAARFLKGGIQTSSDGKHLGGGMQVRAREAGLAFSEDDLSVDLSFYNAVPQSVINEGRLDAEALMFGNYGGISSLQSGLTKQFLDKSSVYYGAFNSSEHDGDMAARKSFEGFNYGYRHSMTSAAELAAVAATPTKLNAGYGNQALIKRSVLAAFCHFVALSPESMLRESRGTATTAYWPMQHVFFVYPSLASAYNLLKDKVDAGVRAVWRDGLLQLGDKLSNYTANDTNQWSEIIYGHLEVYKATGEDRFLHYFERAAVAITKPNLPTEAQPYLSGSLGQHPAGYYMERFAPSATYYNLAMHNLVPAYYNYKNLEEKNPEVYETLRSSLERAIQFEALNWLPEPDGRSLFSPTAMMVKGKVPMYGEGGYPSTQLAAAEFPMAAALLDLIAGAFSESNIGHAATTPHEAFGREDVAMGILRRFFLTDRPDSQSTGGTAGSWTARSYEVFTQEPRTTEKATTPVHETDRVWHLEGVLAWKKNGVYALTYYGNRASTAAHRSGLPFAVWSEGTGSVVLAQNDQNETDCYYSGLFVTDSNGKQHNTATAEGTLTMLPDGSGYTITQAVDTAGSVTYAVAYTESGFTINAAFTPAEDVTVTEAYIALPLSVKRASVSQSADFKTLRWTSTLSGAYGAMEIISSAPAALSAETGSGRFSQTTLQNLSIPLTNGTAAIEFKLTTG